MLFNFIDGAFYVNLDRRLDRKESFEKQIQSFNIEVERLPATEFKQEEVRDNGIHNWHVKVSCTHSHFRAIKEAKNRGWNNVLIFEDDCIFSEDFSNKIQKCVDELKNIEWDICYLGGEPNNYCDSITPNLAKVRSGVYGTHAYIVNSNFFNTILEIPYEAGIVDQLYMNISVTSRNYIISKELLVWQDGNSYSDLWGQERKESYTIYKNAYEKWML